MPRRLPLRLLPLLLALAGALPARAAERITLRSGFSIDCLRHETVGDRVRLVLPDTTPGGASNYMEVSPASIVSVEPNITLPPAAAPAQPPAPAAAATPATLSAAAMHPMLAHAGTAHHIDEDLLASIVRAESNGAVRAISRTGARGLMQLMPSTAAALGVADAFSPAQNIDGGTAYLDRLLTRYHDDIALAVAAYNAGPAAVDRFHGVPPFHETRAYVARVIREFNRRKLAAAAAAAHPSPIAADTLRAGLR